MFYPKFDILVNNHPYTAKIIYFKQIPSNRYTKDSDIDYLGGIEMEYELFDEKGERALWLEKEMMSNKRLLDNVDAQVLSLVSAWYNETY